MQHWQCFWTEWKQHWADLICLIIDSAPVYYCESVLCKTLSPVSFVHSLLLDVLCRVHAELAAIDEEDEKLDSAVKHLQKALELDPDSEHLSSCLHLLQLRSSVHSAPTRPEERAAKLIQQVLHTHSMSGSPRTDRWLLRAVHSNKTCDVFLKITILKLKNAGKTARCACLMQMYKV